MARVLRATGEGAYAASSNRIQVWDPENVLDTSKVINEYEQFSHKLCSKTILLMEMEEE